MTHRNDKLGSLFIEPIASKGLLKTLLVAQVLIVFNDNILFLKIKVDFYRYFFQVRL